MLIVARRCQIAVSTCRSYATDVVAMGYVLTPLVGYFLLLHLSASFRAQMTASVIYAAMSPA